MNDGQMTYVKKASIYSNEVISSMRAYLEEKLAGRDDICIVLVGSFARREASKESDLDFFVLSRCKSGDGLNEIGNEIKLLMEQKAAVLEIRMPAQDGAFAVCVTADSVDGVIGGLGDANDKLTRRMLFLLESEWLYNEDFYENKFDELMGRYIKDSITEHQLSKFFLNDVIRYYRTICVDFDYKTGSIKKSWGDRNIKLLFSRKMLYFSGIVAAAETAQRTPSSKRKVLKNLLRKCPLERVAFICGDIATRRAFRYYDDFLGKLSNPSFRELLVSTAEDRETQGEEFRALKDDGHHFSWELANLLRSTYDSSHPIHHALCF